MESKKIGKYLFEIDTDECPDSPSEYMAGKLCIREHRRYSFPNELDFPFDKLDSDDEEDIAEIRSFMDKYHMFSLDCYEHGGICFSLSGHGMQCQFDTAKGCGYIMLDKSEWEDRELAATVANENLDRYNQYLNGYVHQVQVWLPCDPIIVDGKEYRTDHEDVQTVFEVYKFEDAYCELHSLLEDAADKEALHAFLEANI